VSAAQKEQQHREREDGQDADRGQDCPSGFVAAIIRDERGDEDRQARQRDPDELASGGGRGSCRRRGGSSELVGDEQMGGVNSRALGPMAVVA